MQEKEKEEILNQLDAQMEVIEGLDLESILDYDKMILDLMLTPVLILDNKQQVVYGNKEFLRFSGAKKGRFLRKTIAVSW